MMLKINWNFSKKNNLTDSLDVEKKLNVKKANDQNLIKKSNIDSKTNNSFYYWIGGLFVVFSISLVLFLLKRKSATKKYPLTENKVVEVSNPSDDDALSINELFQLAMKDDHSFYYQFIKTFKDFDKTLLKINPTIKISDVEFCAFVKLNMHTKQIATIKKMTVGAVEAKKHRIRKKLNINSDENMYIWMSRL
ncbi:MULTISPECIES: helix-turn-helix transcriptional regulator [unclassified Chryseobacterium]|uniref:helix-turn-helix transcriptional regulator n=1 Tax=unclassified Chryseobacterium TaxID=2593645 RepID=UPI001040254D|nr:MULTISPECIES: hypothetical protein [unclassified Chryseobacterium]